MFIVFVGCPGVSVSCFDIALLKGPPLRRSYDALEEMAVEGRLSHAESVVHYKRSR